MDSTKVAFVLMPFREPYDSFFRNIYKPALEGAGYKVSRGDDSFTPGSVMADIQASILKADLILCEMSGNNPNVFYELGLAHAVGKPVILVSDVKEQTPFDLRNVRIIMYDDSEPDWDVKCGTRIRAAVSAAESFGANLPAPLVSMESDSDARRKLDVLKTIGIKDWEASMSGGTTTRVCIEKSHTTLRFLGIAATKWVAEEQALRRMFQRHSSNGGHAQFLLLNPDSEACRQFERIKNMRKGALGRIITRSVEKLLDFAEQEYMVSVKFYSQEPRFRIVIIDDSEIVVGMYSYLSDSGEDTPQIILDHARQQWSFYYGFNSTFKYFWQNSVPSAEVMRAGEA